MRKTSSRILATILILLTLAGIATVAFGILGVGSTPTYVQAPVIDKPFSPNDADTYTGPTDPPGTTKNDAPAEAKGIPNAADVPVASARALGALEVSVPSVGLSARIVEGGLTAKGAIDLPDSSLVAHYTPAAALGAPTGSTVIAGHVNYGDGSLALSIAGNHTFF